MGLLKSLDAHVQHVIAGVRDNPYSVARNGIIAGMIFVAGYTVGWQANSKAPSPERRFRVDYSVCNAPHGNPTVYYGKTVTGSEIQGILADRFNTVRKIEPYPD